MADLTILKGLNILNVNGANYIGGVETIEGGGAKISNAIAVTGDNFKSHVKQWILAANLNKLESVEIEGIGATYAKKPFSEEQLMVIDIAIATANYAFKYALANLQNSAFNF